MVEKMNLNEKNYSIDDMFIRCIYVCINSNN